MSQIQADIHIDDVKDAEFDLIALPGGLPGAQHLHVRTRLFRERNG